MAIKLQLINDYFGTCEIDDYDPDGLDQFTEVVQRGTDLGNVGLIQQFTTQLKFVQAARDFILQVYGKFGIEGIIVVNIYQEDPNTYSFYRQAQGQIKMANLKWDEVGVVTNLDQVGFNVVFTNLIDQDTVFQFGGTFKSKNGNTIDFGPPLAQVRLQSKTILKEHKATSDVSVRYEYEPSNITLQTYYITLDTAKVSVDEIETFYPNEYYTDEDINLYFAKPLYQATEAGHLVFTSRYHIRSYIFWEDIGAGTADLESHFYISQRRSGAIILRTLIDGYTTTHVDPDNFNLMGTMDGSFTEEFDVQVGDEFFLEFTIGHTFPGSGYETGRIGVIIDNEVSYFDFKLASTYPDTVTNAMLAYELCERLVQTLTGQQDCFRSTALGRVDSSRVYPQDGFAALTAFSNGWALRGLGYNNGSNPTQNRDLFFNFKDVMDCLTKVWGLAWGFETLDNGNQVVVVEKLEYFYNKNSIITDLGEVGDVNNMVVESVDISRYKAEIDFGYGVIKQIKQINSIDEFNQGRAYVTPLTQVKDKLDLTTTYRGSGYEIETQRRLTTATSDSPLDDDKFIIAVLRDETVEGQWKNERVEHFTDITGLYDAATSYNLRISPVRNILRSLNVLGANVIYGDNKKIVFASGTGNYNMASTLDTEAPVNEKEVLDCATVIPLWESTLYTFNKYLTRQQWALVYNNLYGIFKFTYREKTHYGYIDKISRISDTTETDFSLLKAYGVVDNG